MKHWRAVVEFIGIVAIVASLIFVGQQIQQEQEIAIADTHTSVTSNLAEVASLIQEAPQIWREGLDGEELSPDEEIQFQAMVTAVEAHIFDMYIRFLRLGIGNPERYSRDFSYATYTHPGLRRIVLERREYRESRFAAFDVEGENMRRLWEDQIESQLRSLDASRPSLPTGKRYVFWTGS